MSFLINPFVFASGGGVSYITFDPTTPVGVSLSGGDLVATNTGTTASTQGVSGPSTSAKSTSGKYYFELTVTTITGGGGVGFGIGPTGSAFSDMSTLPPTNGKMCYVGTGNIWEHAGNSGFTIGAFSNGDTLCVAMDCVNGRVWFRKGASGLWNGQVIGSQDPTVGNGTKGGFPFSNAASMIPFATFGSGLVGPAGQTSNVFTANFGSSSFVGSPPAGYTAGWPV